MLLLFLLQLLFKASTGSECLTPKHITTDFWIFDEKKTYNGARIYCSNELGTRLAEVDRPYYQNELWNYLQKDIWQGVRMGTSGRFEWSDGHHYDFDSDTAYENWDSSNGQPNRCIVMLSSSTTPGQWSVVPCQNTYRFACIKRKLIKFVYIICKRHWS